MCFTVVSLLQGCNEQETEPERPESTQAQNANATKLSPVPPPQTTQSGEVRLPAPRWEDWTMEPGPAPDPSVVGLGAEAYHFKGIVYDRADKDAKSTGVVRRGSRIKVEQRVFGTGCDGGGWYAVVPHGFVCTKDGFWVSRTARNPEQDASPATQRRIPYEYAKVVTENAPRFFQVPTDSDLAAARIASTSSATAPDSVEQMMDGIYLLALRPKGSDLEQGFRQTVRGRFVAEEDVEIRPNVPMRGQHLSDKEGLPLAFVFAEERPVFRFKGESVVEAGVAEKHARFAVEAFKNSEGQTFVQSPQGFLVERANVRVATRAARPERIPPGSKWIHVHLPEQTLVAYEGDTPVLATLVSSGIEGFDTPPGVYQIQHKYITTMMNGPDPDEGFYEVEEVPWTMYYYESFALHGAYWHNDFGKVRSHGCTNIPPTDARWLYYWSEPDVPPGWHAATRSPGTYVYITNAPSGS